MASSSPSPREEPLRRWWWWRRNSEPEGDAASQVDKRPQRRPRRRLLWISAIVISVILLLVLLAPTILTSRPAVRIVENMVSGMIGREVVIEGLRFGWITRFRLAKIELPGNKDEANHSLLLVEGIEIPLSLWRAIRGTPYDLDGVRVARFEATAVRRPDGTWNFQDILDAFPGEDDKPDPSEVAEAIVLPFSRLNARIDGIALRVIDRVENISAGWEDGRLDVLWLGGSQPLTLDAIGTFSVGQATLPWRLRAKAEHFADSTNTLALERAILTASTGGMMHEGQIAEGGIFIHGGPGLRDQESVARAVLPLEAAATLLRESELPGSDLVPNAQGELVLRIAAMPEDGISRWRFDGDFIGSGMRAEIEGYEELPSIDMAWNLDGHLDLVANVLSDLALTGRVIGFETLIAVETLSFDQFAQPVGLMMEATLDFAEASQTIALSAGGDPTAPVPLEGHLSFSASATTLSPDLVAAQWTFSIHPGMLSTLEPFAPWPHDQLGDAPLDLSALAFDLAGQARMNIESQSYEWEFTQMESALVPTIEGSGSFDGRTGNGNASLRKVVELDALHAAFGDVLARAAGIDVLDGRVTFETTSGIAQSVTLLSHGQLLLEDFRLRMPESGIALDEDRVVIGWDTQTDMPTATATIHHLSLEAELSTIDIRGLLSPDMIDLALESTLDLEGIAARGLLPEGIAMAGGARINAGANGKLAEVIDMELGIEVDEDFAYFQQGVLQIHEGGAFLASATAVLGEQPVRFQTLDVTELSLGDVLLATLSVQWAEDNRITGTGSMEASIGSVLALFDPEFFAAMNMDLLAEGDSLLRTSFDGHLAHAEDTGWQPVGDWRFDSDLAMDVAYAEWAADWGVGLVEEAVLSHQFAITWPMEEGGTFRMEDSGVIDAAWIAGVAGLTLENATLESTLLMDETSTSFTIDRIATDGGLYEMENMGVRIPSMAASAEANWNPQTETAHLVFLLLEGGDVLDGEITTSFRSGMERWEASGEIGIPSMASLVSFFEFDPPMNMPPVTGGARVTFDMWGGLPGEAAIASGHYPIGGMLEWDFAIDELDGGLDYQVGGFISGGRIDFEEEEGRISASGRAVMREFANLALRAKPLRDIEAEFTVDMHGLGAVAWDLVDFRIGNYGTTARASGNINDLNRALNDTTREGLGVWLQNAALDGRLRAEQDLSGFTGFLPMLAAGGVVDLSFDFRSSPGAAFIAGGLVDLRDVEFHWGELFHLEGANGSWEFAKALLLGTTARRPPPPPAGVFTIDRIAFGLPPFMAELRDTRATLRGVESPITVDLTSRNFVGGTASGNAVLRIIAGDPVVEARMQATGLDIARVALPSESASASRRDWEVSAVSLATWQLRDVAGDRSLEDLNVSVQSTRIGRQALVRLLQAIDPDETDPSIQQSRSALRLGTPTAARGNMRSGLLSFDADLRLATGLQTVLLPILNRQPIGDLLEVYQLQETMAVMPLVRWSILLLMAEDLDTLERTLMQGGGTR